MDPEILKQLQTRLVNGEITQEEYQSMLSALDATGPQPGEASPPPPFVSNSRRVEAPAHGQYLNTAFYLSMWIVPHILGVLCLIGALTIMFMTDRQLPQAGSVAAVFILLAVFVICLIVPQIFFYVMLYRAWAAIQHFPVRTTPGKAVGFCFIPFFNFYWVFVAYYGFTEDFNRVAEAEDRKDLVIPEGVGILPPILSCINALPYLNCLSGLTTLVMWPIFICYVSGRVNRYVHGT